MPSEHDVAFPRLSRTQIDALRRWGHVRPIAPGDVLFQEGDRGFSFDVVLEGAVEIVEQSRGTPREVTVRPHAEYENLVEAADANRSREYSDRRVPSHALDSFRVDRNDDTSGVLN